MIDLHTHSTASDGSDPPERIPELAAANGCRAVALTDHDRMDGLEAAAKRAAEVGVELVPGTEISCEVSTGTMHVLIYFVEPGGPLEEELIRLQEARDARNARMFRRLRDELGLPITPEEVEAEAGGKGIGRPHVAAVLVRNGVVGTIQEAFDRYLAKGQPGYVEKERLYPEQALRLAVDSNAVPVLAHPLSLGLEAAELDRTVGELAALGLAGAEAIYGRYTPEERQGVADLATRHGLVVTGGSDHHGSYKPDLQVGIGRGDLDVPDAALEQLAARRRG
ncbi:MAG: PHP domain-containing protein [Acidimicrobiia bacterium]|nr:PHP domain-containing protein [Acidimicrobiia bacterium]